MTYYNIENLPNYKMDECGNLYNKKGNKIKTFKSKGGYMLCYPYMNGKKLTLLHHRVVAKVFHDNPYDKDYVNHIDGDKTNNHPYNLEWCTPKENSKHSRNTLGNKPKGGDRPKLNMEIAISIREEIKTSNIVQLSKKYKVARTSIKKILDYKSYK